MPNNSLSERYIALFDILGFKSFIESNRLDHVVKVAKGVLANCLDIRDSSQLFIRDSLSIRVFQDTICVLTRGTGGNELVSLLFYCSRLVEAAYLEKIYLRGAVTKGEVFADNNFVLGKGFLRAYHMEQCQEWLGAWVDDCCAEAFNEFMSAFPMQRPVLVPYPIPMKKLTSDELYALNWTVFSSKDDPIVHRFGEVWNDWSKSVGRDERAVSKFANTETFLRFLEENNLFSFSRNINRSSTK